MKNGKRIKLSMVLVAMMLLLQACGGAQQESLPQVEPAAESTSESGQSEGQFNEGTYTATASGHNGDMTLSVTFSEDAIVDIAVVEHQETAGISDAAIQNVPADILKHQSLSVDTVSGATYTSEAILAAVRDCVVQAGGDVQALEKPVVQETGAGELIELTTDVLVLGGGGAGLAASIEAANKGVDVILLERMDYLGGDTARAGGGIEAAGTRFQEANGIQDTPEDFYDFITSRGITYRNSELLRIMTQQAADAVDFLADLGADMSAQVAGHGSPVARAHRPQSGSAGENIVQPMIAEVERLGVQVITGTPGTELLTENGAVVGAKAVAVSGSQEYVIHAKAVVIATGNFATNGEMVAQYDSRLAGVGSNSSPGSLGDGIVMATAVGADLENMDVFRVRPNLPTGIANYIAVSQDGERFMNEYNSSDTPFVDGDDNHVTVHANRTEKYYWILLDNAAKEAQEEALETYLTEGNYFSADTLEELAELMGVDASTLTGTVEAWNAMVAAGEDSSFGRDSGMDVPIEEGPFYAAKTAPTMHNTAGGIRISTSAQVLNEEETPIPGLYAGGEVTGGVHDGVSAVADAIVYGRIAGTSAAEYAAS